MYITDTSHHLLLPISSRFFLFLPKNPHTCEPIIYQFMHVTAMDPTNANPWEQSSFQFMKTTPYLYLAVTRALEHQTLTDHYIDISCILIFRVYPVPTTPSRTGGNPRIRPGSSVVVVAILLEGVVWYAVGRSARSVVEFSGWRSGCGTSSFSRSNIVGNSFFFLSFSCFLSLGLFCAVCPSGGLKLYGWLLY